MKYSILIPTYKAAFLAKCIDSILAQSYEDFELIIVNDASPENIDEIVAKYSDPRIRYYTNAKNCGAVNVVDNWNICLDYAEGDFIICMGDDDELSADCLEQYNLLMDRNPDLDIYHGRVKVIDEDSAFHSLQEARPERESVYSMMWHRMKGRTQYIGDFLYRRSALQAKGGFYKLPLAWGSDDISAYLAAQEHGIANTEKPIFFYRTNRHSITSSSNCMIKLEAIESEQTWYTEFLAAEPTDEVDGYYAQMMRESLNSRFAKKRVGEVAKDIKKNLCRIPYWVINRKQHKLSMGNVLFAIGSGVKNRIIKR